MYIRTMVFKIVIPYLVLEGERSFKSGERPPFVLIRTYIVKFQL